ncbi:hypothetical protein EV191_109209 [Tamaricihabitans halophyticus]|uniref:Protein ImuA n=1 Tax=Tamaricihabitans halophyticus TaxID=1262583 RepID=A0A4R2QJE0_9PSEU|nr:hypothetical protein EV191_109209 [Tamaricihabitans halophyticus]
MPSRGALAPLMSHIGVRTASELVVHGKDNRGEPVESAEVGRVLPVPEALAELLPWRGLRRGGTVAVRGATSLLLALLGPATSAGSWAGVVGMPGIGVLAATEFGVVPQRLALVPNPGAEFAPVVAALLEGMDLVAVRAAAGIRPEHARRLSARARHHKSVLLSFGAWPGAEVELHGSTARWSGVEAGSGYLRTRRLVVEAVGRGAAARPVRRTLLLPDSAGGIAAAEGATEANPARPRELAG